MVELGCINPALWRKIGACYPVVTGRTCVDHGVMTRYRCFSQVSGDCQDMVAISAEGG